MGASFKLLAPETFACQAASAPASEALHLLDPAALPVRNLLPAAEAQNKSFKPPILCKMILNYDQTHDVDHEHRTCQDVPGRARTCQYS